MSAPRERGAPLASSGQVGLPPRRSRSSRLARLAPVALVALVALWAALLAGAFPALTEYRFGADEGTYARQASAVLDGGLAGLRALARAYLDDPRARDFPSPVRVGHVLVAALALHLRRSVTTLSWLSLGCHLATVGLVFALGRRAWGARVAWLAAALTLVSPLASGLALRALADAHHLLSLSATWLALLAFVATGRRRHLHVFLAALGWSLLVKETAYFLVPFYVGVLLWVRRARPEAVRARDLALTALGVPLATLALTAALLGGPTILLRVIAVSARGNAVEPHSYLRAFGSGPWFEYVIDGLLLAPATTLAGLLYAGHLATLRRPPRAASVMLALTVYVFVVFAFLPKNPRFVASLDLLARVGAAAMACVVAERLAWRRGVRLPLAVALVAALGAVDVASFRRHFVAARTYDPVAYNLLADVRMIPTDDAAPDPRAAARPSADALLALSRARYEARDFWTSIEASRASLALRADSPDALNNLGLALAELGRWDESIDAFEAALRLRPAFDLARNNLAWTRERAAGRGR